MSGCLGNVNPCSAPYKMIINNDQEHPLKNNNPLIEKPPKLSSININNTSNPKSSIRRTFSADMSSPKWLNQNGLKRVQSSEQLLDQEGNIDHHDMNNNDASLSNNDEKHEAFEDVWKSIQAEKRTFASLLTQPKNDGSGSGSGNLPPPYVHPLVRRSTSSLSEKSLEICTESLGSETGSDGFSSYPASEPGDSDKEVEDQNPQVQAQAQVQAQEIINNNNVAAQEIREHDEMVNRYFTKYLPPTLSKSRVMTPKASFPPPLPSLSHREGSNIHMRTYRQEGRLVVEAVSVASHNCFKAERHDGRLLLTLASDDENVAEDQDHLEECLESELDEVENDFEDEEMEEEEEDDDEVEEIEEKELAIVLDELNVHRSPLMMSKIIELTTTRNRSTWPRNFNTAVVKNLLEDDEEEEDEKEVVIPLTKSPLPPSPRMARVIPSRGAPTNTATAEVAALNAYEYYWRRSTGNTNSATATLAVIKPLAVPQQQNGVYSATKVPQMVKDDDQNTNTNTHNKKLLLGSAHNGKSFSTSVEQREVVLVKAAGTGQVVGGGGATTGGEKQEYLVPLLRGCKEPRRSLLFWEPHCIAT